MLLNACPDLQATPRGQAEHAHALQQLEQYCTDETLLYPFSANYRLSAHDQTQRIINSISKRPGSSAERIRKIIPEQASLFNEKVKPELNRILNERNVKRDSLK